MAGFRETVKRAVLLAVAAVLLAPGASRAGTTGKISGTVLDQDGKPVVAATILVTGTRLGAYADAQGQFNILNIPPGTYSVNFSRLGYKTTVVKDVLVSSDNTTRLEVKLESSEIKTQEVVVTAERPPIDVNLTSSRTTLSSKQIEDLPVQELEDVVNLQAGVVDGHFRGGRTGEVQYQVDGVSVNNAYDNSSSLRLDRSLLQEVQVISGTFDAEYGQAMSGVVNAVLKEGTPNFQWNGELYMGGFVFPDAGGDRIITDTVRPTSIQSYQLSASGPLPLPGTVFLLSGRHYHFDDWIYGTRRFVPTDSSNFETKTFDPTGDGKQVPLGYSREWSGVVKLTNTALPNTRISYQALFNHIKGRRADWAFRLEPDGLSRQRTTSITHGIDVDQTLGKKTFLKVSLRENYFDYKDMAYDNLYDPRYDAAGQPTGTYDYELGAFVQGVQFNRFVQRTNAVLFNASLVSQVTARHQLKTGFEVQFPYIKFGSPGYLTYTTVDGQLTLVRHDNDPPNFPGVKSYRPRFGAAYVQDAAEFKNITVRGGLRFEYFDANSTIPSDLANPANSIQGAPQSVPRATTVKTSVSPRLGVAYPITENAAVHFAYGHFYQFPAIGQIFSNAEYGVLANLQAGGIDYGVLGNPDVKPEKTVQYELGYKQALGENVGLDFTAFYKDIRNLLGVQFISTYNGAEYARLANADFGNVVGFTVSLDDRKLGPAHLSMDYTWQLAQGNSSDPRETATRASAGEDPRPRLVPFNWDQRHTFNLTVAVDHPGDYTTSAVLRVGSGQPYTPVLTSGFGAGLGENSGRKPLGMVLDLRGEKSLGISHPDVSMFGRVFNVFDARYFNGPVYSSTGSPYYSRFPVTDAVALGDPTRYYAPRRFEVGLSFRPGSED